MMNVSIKPCILLLFQRQKCRRYSKSEYQYPFSSSKKSDENRLTYCSTLSEHQAQVQQRKVVRKWNDISTTVKAKKALYNVDGKNASERAKDFEKLNYLLSKKVASSNKTPKNPQSKNAQAGSINIVALAAKAKLKKLRLKAKLKAA